MRSFSLDFLTRPQCGLCDSAASITSRVAAIARAEIRIRDVTQDQVLFDEYEHRIPVVLGPGERVLAEGRVGFWALLAAVMKARARWVVGSRQ